MKAKIVSDPKVLNGKPVISGTRISVELIMNFLAAGMTVDQIHKEYSELKKPEILAAIDYAGKLVSKVGSITNQQKEIAVLHEITR